MLAKKYGFSIQYSLFALNNQDSAFCHTRKNSKMYHVTSK